MNFSDAKRNASDVSSLEFRQGLAGISPERRDSVRWESPTKNPHLGGLLDVAGFLETVNWWREVYTVQIAIGAHE
jgi:hypothetical protein